MGKELRIEIDSELHSHRIEYVLEKRFKISSSMIKRLKREVDGVLLNGVRSSVITKVKNGDVLIVNIPCRKNENIAMTDMALEILFEDEDIIAVNKPGNMSVHPSRTNTSDTLLNGVMKYLGKGASVHIITRLDRETSGVVLMAKNPQTAAILSDDIKNKRFRKEYIAIVNGTPAETVGKVCAPIGRKEGKGIARCVSYDGKDATTIYELIEKSGGLSLMKLIPVTGRTHQIRVHMSYIGCPVYGDCMYGAAQRGERVRLHCQSITFRHPVNEDEITLSAQVPEDFKILFE